MASPMRYKDGRVAIPITGRGGVLLGYGKPMTPEERNRAGKRAARQNARLERVNKRRAKRGLEPRRARRKSVKPAIPMTKSPPVAIPDNYTNPFQPVYAKGGVATKNAIGHNDYRKSGYTLSTVDNRKKK